MAFGPLLPPKFALVEVGQRSARYQSDRGVFVLVFHDPADRYVGFKVGLLSEPRDALTDAEVRRLAGATELRGLAAAPGSDLSDVLHELALRLVEYGEDALAGDPTVFDRARELRRDYTQRYMDPGSDR